MEELSEEGYYTEGLNILNGEGENIGGVDLSLLEPSLKAYIEKLEISREELEDLKRKKQTRDELVEIQDEKNLEYQKIENDIRRCEELLLNEKENYKVKYVEFNKNNRLFSLNEDDVKNVIKIVDSSVNENDLNKILEVILISKGNIENSLTKIKSIKDGQVGELNKNISELKEEIENLKSAKEMAPKRSQAILNNRERLLNENIPFVPLYKAIDFKPGVDENLKNKIESALYEMGLLDALCIEEKYKDRGIEFKEGMADKYIFPEPNFMRHTISNYLIVDKDALGGVSFDAVDSVLSGIFLEDNTLTYLDEKGNYGMGILAGKGDDSYKAQYIGEAQRKKLRIALIEEKNAEIEALKVEIQNVIVEIKVIDNKIEVLNFEYEKSPKLDDMREGFWLVRGKLNDITTIEEEIKRVGDELFNVNHEYSLLKRRVYDLIKEIEVKTLNDVSECLVVMEEYKEKLIDAKGKIYSLKSNISIKEILESNLESVREDIDNIYYEINKISIVIGNYEIRKRSVEEVLCKSSIDEIKMEIKTCLKIKGEYPDKIQKLRDNIIKIRFTIEGDIGKCNELNTKREVCEPKVNRLKEIFEEEEALELLMPKREGDELARALEILKENEIKNKNREDFTKILYDNFNSNLGDIRDYTPKVVNILQDENEGEFAYLRKRLEIKCRIQGKEVGFLVLMEEISKNIEEQKLLISEEERRIFQEVLVNTISQKINGKIQQSKSWVKKVNALMESMDTSSSLKLSLSWQPKKADSEGLLNISEIIDIFERKNLCKEEEFKALGDHFNKKVQEELRKYEGTGESRNYHSIIKDVLDYREWYEFKLHFTKRGEKKKELTNNAFFQFSGGEKAMSMYIPLFSAVYARYEKARPDCPRIITMDEAFAGVDENNIRDMFRLLKVLDIDYMLNSQVLWGDYDTVDSLAIAELIREENDDVVTVLRYSWNGKEKVLIN